MANVAKHETDLSELPLKPYQEKGPPPFGSESVVPSQKANTVAVEKIWSRRLMRYWIW